MRVVAHVGAVQLALVAAGFVVLYVLMIRLLVLAVRAPVTLIHVTGTSLVACGCYLQQRNGGFRLVGYFAVAVHVHSAWNGLLVSLTLASAAMPSSGVHESAPVLALHGALSLMLALLVAFQRSASDGVERVNSVSGPLSREV